MDWLKDLLGAELYAQLTDKLKDSKVQLADLSKGEHVPKADLEAVQGQIATANETIASLKADLGKMQALDFEGLQKAVKEAEQRAQQAEKVRDEKLAAMEYDGAVARHVGGLRFTSELARDAFAAKLRDKGLKLENGQLLGAEDFTRQLREQNPTAFEKEPAGGAGFENKKPPENTGGDTVKEALHAALYSTND